MIVWDRGRPRPQRAAGAQSFRSRLQTQFRAARSFAGGAPAVPDNHLTLGQPLSTSVELKRQIGLGTATALIVGEVIAVGIFLTPAGMAKSLGSPLWLLIVWLLMGGMALCGALCYGELAARFPEAGGGYVYLREAYGRPVAFLYGWMALLVMDPGLTALLAVGLASYVGYIFVLSSSGIKTVAIGSIRISSFSEHARRQARRLDDPLAYHSLSSDYWAS